MPPRRQSPSPWRPLRWPAALVAVVLVYGVTGYMFLEGWSFIDALYMTLITLTTVGFSEVRTLDSSGALFTMSLLVLGVAIVVVTLSIAAGSIAEGGLGERVRRRKMQRRIEGLEDHYIVCAYGRVGRTVVEGLKENNMSCVVLESDEELEEDLIEDQMPFIIEDLVTEEVLIEAGVERARGLVCALDSDADNVFITLTARSLNPKLFIVARAAEPTTGKRLMTAGADRVVSPYVTSGRHMARLALQPGVVDYIEVGALGASPIRIEELQVEQGSNIVNQPLSQACGDRIPLCVQREDGELLDHPAADLALRAGDLLVLLDKRATAPPEVS
jgi:voltage-gated potassium channel